jgi:hypothetical protein
MGGLSFRRPRTSLHIERGLEPRSDMLVPRFSIRPHCSASEDLPERRVFGASRPQRHLVTGSLPGSADGPASRWLFKPG